MGNPFSGPEPEAPKAASAAVSASAAATVATAALVTAALVTAALVKAALVTAVATAALVTAALVKAALVTAVATAALVTAVATAALVTAVAAPEDARDSSVVAVHTTNDWNQTWNSQKPSNKLMVIDFSASWCGPCRFIESAFEAMSAKFADVLFLKIDVDELPDVARQWKVQALPTFVLVKGAEEFNRVVGAEKDELERKIVQLTKK